MRKKNLYSRQTLACPCGFLTLMDALTPGLCTTKKNIKKPALLNIQCKENENSDEIQTDRKLQTLTSRNGK